MKKRWSRESEIKNLKMKMTLGIVDTFSLSLRDI